MRLLIQASVLMMVLMFGIFLGIDTAEQNIHRNQGSEGAPRAVHITPQDGRVEIAVLGHVYQTESPVMINREPEEKNGSEEALKGETSPVDSDDSWLTVAGNQAGEGIKKTTRKALDQVLGWFQEKIE